MALNRAGKANGTIPNRSGAAQSSRNLVQENGVGGGIPKTHATTLVGRAPGSSTVSTKPSGTGALGALGIGTISRDASFQQQATLSIDQQQDSWNRTRQLHQQQLLTEHFGFSPLSFVDDVINSVNNMIYQASMALQHFVETQMDTLKAQGDLQLDNNVHIIDECAKCMHKFETLLESAVDRNFDRFELYALKNLFGVPEKVDIVLPHYEELDFDISVEKDQKLDEELELLRSQLIATKALNYRLRKELEIEERRKRQLEKCREQIHFLKEAVNQYSDVAPVPQTLIFVRDNIETLHRRFETFHNKLQQGVKANTSTPTSAATVTTSTSNLTSATPYSPADNIAQALRETLLCMEPDQRALYIRSVVRRQIEEHLGLDSLTATASTRSGSSNSGGLNSQSQAPPTP